MRVIVMGGTRFVGRAVVAELRGAGHDVLLVHRGVHEPPEMAHVPHLHVDRRHLSGLPEADGVVDLSAATARDARILLDAVAPGPRLVVASSMDVYRAYASLWAGVTTDPVPLTERAALRTGPPPDRHGPPPEGWDIDMSRYDKLDVEAAYLARGAVVCRLPFVYGPHDYNRREEFVLRRVRAGRARMPIGPGGFLVARGHVAELARGMRLALESSAHGEVVNLCEPACAPMRLWAQQIVEAAGADLELVGVPAAALPDDLALTGDVSQHLLADPAKARALLGWTHGPVAPAVRDSVAWHLAHPPEDGQPDFAADDDALASA